MKVMTGGFDVITVTGKYSFASIEYAGRVAYSMVDRGGTATKTKKYLVKFFQPIGSAGGRPFAFVKDKVFQPVGSAVSRPFVFVKDKAKSIFPAQLRYDEDMKNLLEKVMKIEDRLVYIEKHGVVMKGEAAEEKKAISKEKSMLLQVVLAENKLLRKAGRK